MQVYTKKSGVPLKKPSPSDDSMHRSNRSFWSWGCVVGDPLQGEGQMPGSQKSWEKSLLVHGVTWRPGCFCGALAADFACGGCGQAGNGKQQKCHELVGQVDPFWF